LEGDVVGVVVGVVDGGEVGEVGEGGGKREGDDVACNGEEMEEGKHD